MKDRVSPVLMAAAVSSLAAVAALLWYFHNQFWWPADEGVYAYVAQRLLAGDALHRDLVDLHGGYGNLLNALAFKIFGEDLLSLRYPLVALTLLQSGLVFVHLKERGPAFAAAGALAAGSLSFIQFLNPSANWYALFLCFVTIVVAARIDAASRTGLAALGFILGLCFLTRQLSGVLLAMGTLTWLMLRLSGQDRNGAIAGRLFAGVLGIGLVGYLVSKSSSSAIVLIGLGPLSVIAIAIQRVRLDVAALGRALGYMSLGAAMAAFPLAVQNMLNGALLAWIHDIFVTALLIHGQEFIGQESFWNLMQLAVDGLISASTLWARVSGFGWLIAILIVPLTAYLCVRSTYETAAPSGIQPLPVIAPFWAVVSVHYQIPIYLFFVLPVVVTAFLALAPRRFSLATVALIVVWSVVTQAGQPLSRNLSEVIEGQRSQTPVPANLPRVSLRIPEEDREAFASVIKHVDSRARPGELLMTLPMDPELNFMTGRKSPVRYYGTQLGLVTEDDVIQTISQLNESAPIFVVYRRDDKYLTPLSIRLLDEVQSRSPAPVTIGPFDLYRFPAADERNLSPPRE